MDNCPIEFIFSQHQSLFTFYTQKNYYAGLDAYDCSGEKKTYGSNSEIYWP